MPDPSPPRAPLARILVVEDYAPTLEALVEPLIVAGYAVDGVASAVEVAQAIQTQAYDLVVGNAASRADPSIRDTILVDGQDRSRQRGA